MGASGLAAHGVHATSVLHYAKTSLAVTILTLSSSLAVSCRRSGDRHPHKDDIPAPQSQSPQASRPTVPVAGDALES